MKIHDPNLAALPPGPDRANSAQSQKTDETSRSAKTGALSANERGKQAAAPGGFGGDKVEISSVANALRSEALETPERTARLERLSQEIRAGRYQVDSAALSQRIVDDMIRE